MEKELWLSRDDGRKSIVYNIHRGEPDKSDGVIFNGFELAICSTLFHQYVEGARLRKGRKRKIKRILIELED